MKKLKMKAFAVATLLFSLMLSTMAFASGFADEWSKADTSNNPLAPVTKKSVWLAKLIQENGVQIGASIAVIALVVIGVMFMIGGRKAFETAAGKVAGIVCGVLIIVGAASIVIALFNGVEDMYDEDATDAVFNAIKHTFNL